VRPLTLTVEGLRSFRAPVEVSFEGRDHIAIIGDTGAGKSSILEAMTYALYGRTTFTGQANQEILNDLAVHARVTLRFTVAGRAFEVTRVLRRASDRTVGAARASLTEFGQDGAEVRKIEQVRQVDARVQEILGLDAKAFLRTVVLPQGQFAQLLVGDDPAARAAILRQVWRTDELTRAGHLADEALVPLGELAWQVAQALDGTPDDLDAHMRGLRVEAERRADIAKAARDRHRAAVAARDALAKAEERGATARTFLEKMGHFDFAAVIASGEEIGRCADGISAERATAESQLTEFRERLKAIPPDDDGLDHQSIGSARAVLQSLPSRAETAQSAARRARAEAAEAEQAAQHAADLEGKLQALDSQLSQREAARLELSSALADADTNLGRAQGMLRDIRQMAANGAAFQGQADGKTRQATLLREEAARLQETDLAEAGRRSAQADEDLTAAQRRNAGAAASVGLRHGDDCPVCSRPLPREWKPVAAEDLDIARSAHRAAQDNLTSVRDKVRELATRAEEVGGIQAAELGEQASRSWETARTAAADLAPLIGRDQVILTDLPPDDELLRSLSAAANTSRERLGEHDSKSQELRDQRAADYANLTGARSAFTRIKAACSRISDETAAAVRELRSDLASLPLELRVDVTLPENPVDIQAVQISGVDAASELLSERTRELDRRAEHRQQLREALDAIGDDIRELGERWDTRVIAPGNMVIAAVNRHRDTLGEGIALLGVRDLTLPEAASLTDPARLLDIISTLRETTDTVARRTHALAETSKVEAEAARQTITRVASEAATPSVDSQALDADTVVEHAADKATEAEVDARTAAMAADDFVRLVGPLAALQRARNQLDLTHKALRDLSAALKPGAFPKWLTLRRSRALLIHATRLFGQMSGGRYAFAEIGDENAEWRIVDNDSNLARTPASLSGGEQFIASLALALGMVEMMARSGGRLESLWLDEGFGSLDRSNLDAAIEALTSIASRGRMVAIISHIRAVADQVDHVLAVTREATGTQARWLSASQRAELAVGELGSEIAGAMSGLLE
jgi:DNA repair protein SbcC/Rad50